jgi:hypothetical protein
MRRPVDRFALLACFGLGLMLLFSLGSRASAEHELTAEELIQRHLKSIAPLDRLKARQSFALRGDCVYRILSGGALSADGMSQIVSKGKAYNILFSFAAGEYGGTEYLTDGKKTDTRYTSGGQVNPLWIFLEGYDVLLTEGLLGGELTTAWSLLDVKHRKPKLSYRGLQKVDGRELHRLDYRMRKGGGGLQVRLYFEPETYHHVLSTYEVVQSAPAGSDPDQSARQRVTRQRIEERFADFENLNGYVLPSSWTLEFFKSNNDANAIQPGEGFGTTSTVRSMNTSPGLGGGVAGPALTGPGGTGTILLQWKTKVTNSAADVSFSPNLITIG